MKWTLLLNIITTILVGGSSFIVSCMSSSEVYGIFSISHISAVYLSAILQLSIAASAPKLLAQAFERGTNAAPSLLNLNWLAIGTFTLITMTTSELISNQYSLSIEAVLFTIVLTIYFTSAFNISGILYGAGSFLKGVIFQLIMTTSYILILIYNIGRNEINYQIIMTYIWMLILIMYCYSSYYISKIKKPYQSIKELFINGSFINYLLPSAVAGVLNGGTLFIVFSTYSSTANLESKYIGGLAYLFLVKSFITFVSTALNRYLFYKLSNLYHNKGVSKIKENIKNNIKYSMISMVISISLFLVLYQIFEEIYFWKFGFITLKEYLLMLLLVVLEVVYLTLYQKIQVYGLIIKSLLYISLPTIMIAAIAKVMELIITISSVFLVQIIIMIYSLSVVMYLNRKL
jgi:hypothetical protein